MKRLQRIIRRLASRSRIAVFAPVLVCFAANGAISAPVEDEPEFAPIIERKLDYQDFTLKTLQDAEFSLRDYVSKRRLVIVAYVAGWCKNSNENGHTLKRLYDSYNSAGLGVIVVSEYSDRLEIQTHINRIGIEYPVVIETENKRDRRKSLHYRYRNSVGDSRKWGTPFYVIIDARNVEPAGPHGLLARQVHTVSGELVESEARSFIESRLNISNK
ncbi:MAG TPA: redoxin domain-containing protein [Blastocatellia bacterium]|nr:redoxin domain-containing protein [Blastocatellia bacterium]